MEEEKERLSLIAEILYLREINCLQSIIIANKGTEGRGETDEETI